MKKKKISTVQQIDRKVKEVLIVNAVVTFISFLLYYFSDGMKHKSSHDLVMVTSIFFMCAALLILNSILSILYFKCRGAALFFVAQSIGIPILFLWLTGIVLWGLSNEEELLFITHSQVNIYLLFSISFQLIVSVLLFFKSKWYRRTVYALNNDKHHAYDIVTEKLNPLGFNGTFIDEYANNRHWLVAMPMAGFLSYGIISLLFPGWGKIFLVYLASCLITFGGIGLSLQGITSYFFVRKIEKRYNVSFVVGDVKFPATRKLPEEQAGGNLEN
ncbi:hypothetical protein EOE67_11080 [Rheinheimera riviphila]|uniref:Uncharacterized protein n=1 Tax=Rheinheimera riviphila TaxID=1834037 RepID=A0A437QRK6_9GAMM|nr:hypothetical protein [Rheinheimera riviphila]RVU37134.1 hypothetical protein EOE67_11080 [Rheinheimera riviphila]